MWWAGHVTRKREVKKCKRFWWESQNERDHSEDQGVDGSVGSKWIVGRLVGGVWSGFTWFRTGIVGGFYECSDEPLGSGPTELFPPLLIF
jgi:hypothetical protein